MSFKLPGIISISGKPGLYKVVAQSKNSVIVESLIDKKKFPARSSDRISALDDISIYSIDDDIPLTDVFLMIFNKEDGKTTIDHKVGEKELREYMFQVMEDYDEERVYHSDLKKLFQWYNVLIGTGTIAEAIEGSKTEEIEEASEEDKA